MSAKAPKPSTVRQKNPPRAWQRMLSGRRLDLIDPSPLDIEIEDIAHGLARVARWNGQTVGDQAFSVAQHSLVVEELVRIMAPRADRATLLYALLHDAGEYVIGDMISPFKAALGVDYRKFEDRLERAVNLRFGLPPKPEPKLKKLVKKADLMCAWLEATQLAGFGEEEANSLFIPPPPGVTIDVTAWTARQAQDRYVARFRELES
jgi:uncharacterized protein